MIDVEKYLDVPYQLSGRTIEGLDCWGLVLCARKDMGLPDIDSDASVNRSTPVKMQRQFKRIASRLDRPKDLAPGAIAAVFRAGVFVHVGVVIMAEGRLAVLETNPATGVRWMYLERFLKTYFKVEFYSD